MDEMTKLARRTGIHPLCPIHPEGMAGPLDFEETTEFYSCQRPGCEMHWSAASDYFRFYQEKPFRTFRQVREETRCSKPGHGHKFIARRRGNKAVWECSVEGCSEAEEKLLSPSGIWEKPNETSQSVVTAAPSAGPLGDRGAAMQVPAAKKRPGWVWAISIYYAISFVVLGVSIFLILSGAIPMTPALKAYFGSLRAFDIIGSVVQPLLALSAAAALFLLRKQATYLFWASLAVATLADLWRFALRSGIGYNSKPGASTGVIIGFGIQLAVCLYAENLRIQGTLR